MYPQEFGQASHNCSEGRARTGIFTPTLSDECCKVRGETDVGREAGLENVGRNYGTKIFVDDVITQRGIVSSGWVCILIVEEIGVVM